MNPAVSLHQLTAELLADAQSIVRGGGDSATERQHAKGRLTARERVELLIDAESPQLELGLWSAHGMYDEWGGATAAGVVICIADVGGRRQMIIANDATVKAGVFFPRRRKRCCAPSESPWSTACR